MINYREETFDIVIVGGGFSGVAAAIAAAREGASVLIADKNGGLGGSAVCASVVPFMRYWCFPNPGETADDRYYINNGIFREILDQMTSLGGFHEPATHFNPEILKVVLDRMCKKHGIKVLYHAFLFDVESEGRSTRSASFATTAGTYIAKAKIFIDASGDGHLAFLSGCEYELGRIEDGYCQPITTNFRISNIDFDKCGGFGGADKLINAAYKKAKDEGKLINPRENVLCFRTSDPRAISFNMTRIVKKNPVDPFDISESEAVAREQMIELYDLVKNNVPGFEEAVITLSGPDIGIRESRRIIGDYVINADDILSCRAFDDSVACGAYSIDIHNPSGTGTHIEKIPKGEYYKIPYRSLIAKDKDNLLVVGRCISSTHEAQSAYRVMPIVCCIGEGGGVAAGKAIADNVSIRNVDIAEVRRKLKNEYNATID